MSGTLLNALRYAAGIVFLLWGGHAMWRRQIWLPASWRFEGIDLHGTAAVIVGAIYAGSGLWLLVGR
jgi:hypothetical protein